MSDRLQAILERHGPDAVLRGGLTGIVASFAFLALIASAGYLVATFVGARHGRVSPTNGPWGSSGSPFISRLKRTVLWLGVSIGLFTAVPLADRFAQWLYLAAAARRAS
jgi:hypothetical protein